MMAGIYKSLFLLLACAAIASGQNVINRVVTAQCYKSSKDNTLTTNFKTELNGDEINYLLGLDLMVGSNPEMYSIDTNCLPYFSADLGTLSMDTYIDLTGAAQPTNPCGVREVYSATNPAEVIGYTWRIGLRYFQQVYQTWRDRDYTWTCLIDTATDTWLNTNLQVVAPGPILLTPVTPTITFTVIRNGVDVTSCQLGQLLQLQLKFYVPNWNATMADILPSGVYGYNTYVNWEPNFSSITTANMLIGSNGCPIANNRLALDTSQAGGITGGFTKYTVGLTGTNNADLQFIARTKYFRCRKYADRSMLYFVTTAHVCVGPYAPTGQADVNCIDYCQFGPSARRRKRETLSQGNYTDVVTSIRVIDEEDEETGAESDTGSTALLIVAPIVGLLVIITAVIGVMLCCWMNRRNDMRKRRLDSRTSSENSIPRKF